MAASKLISPLLDSSDELVGADDVGASGLSLAGLVALSEDSDADGLAGAVRQGDGAADVLVGLAGIDAEAEVNLDGLVELGGGGCSLTSLAASTGA